MWKYINCFSPDLLCILSVLINKHLPTPSTMSDSQALSILMKSPVSQGMIQHLVNTTLKVIQCKKSKTVSPPNSPAQQSKPLPSLMTFISRLVRYTNVYTGTLLSTLVYLEKLRSKLPKNAEGLPCTLHRIFLACLIISSKFNNDSSPKNLHWAEYTDGLFTTKDINLMERQLLNLLNWDVQINNQDLARNLRKFTEPIKNDLKKATRLYHSMPSRSLYSYSLPTLPPHQQQVSTSPVSYHDIISRNKQHYRSNSSSSVSSASSAASSMSSESSVSTPVSDINPQLLYQPTVNKSLGMQSYSYTFNQDDLNNYVPVQQV